MQYLKHFLLAILLAVSQTCLAGWVNLLDITLSRDLHVEAQKICDHICVGNEKKSHLSKFMVNIGEGAYSPFEINVRLRNRQHVIERGWIKVDFILYSDTSTLVVKGRFDNTNCSVVIDKVKFTNDLYRLGHWIIDKFAHKTVKSKVSDIMTRYLKKSAC